MMAELENIADADISMRHLLNRKVRLDHMIEKAETLVSQGNYGSGKYY
jgi:hypothetical protein